MALLLPLGSGCKVNMSTITKIVMITNQQSQESSEQNPELTTIMLLPQVLPLYWVQTLVLPQSWSRGRSRARPASCLEVEEMWKIENCTYDLFLAL